jgi:hypothetical protein
VNETLVTFAGILILATLVEGLVEYLVKPIFLPQAERGSADPPQPDTSGDEEDKPLVPLSPATRVLLIRYVSAGVGMLLCVAYRADLLALAGLTTNMPVVGSLITGIVVGRGANYLHDLVSQWAKKPALPDTR